MTGLCSQSLSDSGALLAGESTGALLKRHQRTLPARAMRALPVAWIEFRTADLLLEVRRRAGGKAAAGPNDEVFLFLAIGSTQRRGESVSARSRLLCSKRGIFRGALECHLDMVKSVVRQNSGCDVEHAKNDHGPKGGGQNARSDSLAPTKQLKPVYVTGLYIAAQFNFSASNKNCSGNRAPVGE